MAGNILPTFPPFDCTSEPSSIGERWKKWKDRFLNFLVAMDIKDDTRKRATSDIFATLPETGEAKDFKIALGKLDEHFNPQKNISFAVYLFRQCQQQTHESLDQFCTRLREKASHCNFADKDAEIKQQIIQGCKSSKLRRRAQREPQLTLQKLLTDGRCLEMSELHATTMEGQQQSQQKGESSINIHQVTPPNQSPISSRQTPRNQAQCFNCGGSFPHPNGRSSCPAWGKSCRNCGKPNHFSRFCRSRDRRAEVCSGKVKTPNIKRGPHLGDRNPPTSFLPPTSTSSSSDEVVRLFDNKSQPHLLP